MPTLDRLGYRVDRWLVRASARRISSGVWPRSGAEARVRETQVSGGGGSDWTADRSGEPPDPLSVHRLIDHDCRPERLFRYLELSGTLAVLVGREHPAGAAGRVPVVPGSEQGKGRHVGRIEAANG